MANEQWQEEIRQAFTKVCARIEHPDQSLTVMQEEGLKTLILTDLLLSDHQLHEAQWDVIVVSFEFVETAFRGQC